jgi:hypothetical protein
MDVVETPVDRIKRAFELFVFSCFLDDAINNNRIKPKTFSEQITLPDGKHRLNFKIAFRDVQLKPYAKNICLMALGTTAISASKAMEVFGPLDPNQTGKFGSARVILYQIRCAFAHDPLIPVWTPNVKNYNRTYRVRVQVPSASGKTCTRTIKLHPPTLKGLELCTNDLGGLAGYFGLLQYCLAKVQKHPMGNKPHPSPAKP